MLKKKLIDHTPSDGIFNGVGICFGGFMYKTCQENLPPADAPQAI